MGFADQDFVVGFVGRRVPQKTPLRLVDAFAIAARQRPDLRLGVVGDGVLRQETERALAVYGMGARARFVGGRDGRDFIPGFDCLLCRTDHDSFGLVLVVALTVGVPTVSTPV